MEKMNGALRVWVEKNAEGPWAQWVLSAVSFCEASFFLIPPGTILMAMITLGHGRRWLYLALLTTLTSVLGGLFGYFIGAFLYDTVGVWVIETYELHDVIARVGDLFADNAFWSIFVAALTPIPYKAFTISAGFFTIDILIFTVASFLGRGLRFLIMAYLAKVFGEHIANRMFTFVALAVIGALLVIVLFSLWSAVS